MRARNAPSLNFIVMNPTIGGAILQAGGSLLNNGLSMWYQSQEAKKARLFNAEQAAIQRDWQESMWNMNNAYNSPSAQMQRARDAGLNPSMLYGQPVAESSQASGGAEASTSIPSVPSLSNPFDGFALLDAQRNLMESQADLFEKQSGKTAEEKHRLQLENAMLRIEKDAYDKASRTGIIDKAIESGFAKEIYETDAVAYEVMEMAWNYLIYTGVTDDMITGEYGASTGGEYGLGFMNYNPESLKRARDLFVGDQKSQQATNDAIQAMQKYSASSFESDQQFFDFLLEHKDEWWSKMIRGARWILKEYGAPSFSFGSNTSTSGRETFKGGSSYWTRGRKKSFGFGIHR